MLDAALPNMISQPLRTRLTISTTAITGTETAEGEEKVISQLALTNEAIEARKAAAIVVITDELARLASSSTLIGAALRRGVVAATDASFLSYLIALTTPIGRMEVFEPRQSGFALVWFLKLGGSLVRA
jgi:hypothetical protein